MGAKTLTVTLPTRSEMKIADFIHHLYPATVFLCLLRVTSMEGVKLSFFLNEARWRSCSPFTASSSSNI